MTPSTRIRFPDLKRKFFLPIWPTVHSYPAPEWTFLKTPAFRLRVDRQKWRFSNTIISCIIYYKHYACSVRDAIVFPLFRRFLCGPAKTNRIRYVWTRIISQTNEKNLRFQKYRDTCGRSLEGLKTESTMSVSKTRGRCLSLFNECCFRVRVRVRVTVRVDINSKPNLILTPANSNRNP